MKKVILYLFLFLLFLIFILYSKIRYNFPDWLVAYKLPIECGIAGGFGGILYCLRAIYINKSVNKNWDDDWNIWYYIRPIVSIITGVVSFIFLKAGLLILEANSNVNSTNLGYLALAFIAGLNVDKFINKIENIAQATWGIEPSRVSKRNKEK